MEDDPIRRAQSGDQAAFRQLVESYTWLVWRTAQALLPDRSLVEDVMQEAWIDVWRGLPGFERQRPFRPWLLTIVARRCWMAARRRALPTVPLEGIVIEEVPGAEDIAERVIRLEADAAVQAALRILPPDQQRVLALRYFADLELHEIALVMDTPVGTVKSRLHRAMSILRARLQPSYTRAGYREGLL
jgi:RNA polymerase sigma-70 factor (ECF subfamily)